MRRSEKFKKPSTEALASGGTSPLVAGFSSATVGSEYPLGKVQIQSL